MPEKAVILSACRTPIGRFLGGLSRETAPKLGSIAVRDAVKRSQVKEKEVDRVIMGNVLTGGLGQNPARQATLFSGLPSSTDSLLVNKVCASGMAAVASAFNEVRLGESAVVVAGGMESMSQSPHFVHGLRHGKKLGNFEFTDSLIYDGLWCAHNDEHMGALAEKLAEKYKVSRDKQDEYALQSHEKAVKAIQGGKFKDEIVSVETTDDHGSKIVVENDECPRADTSIERLSKLKSAFTPGGSVTAGNSSSINDGASALVIASERYAKENGLKPLALIEAYGTAAVDPKDYGIAPVSAVKDALKKSGRKLSEYDLHEENEAFAAQTLAVVKELGLDTSILNVNGGAIALGHPIGSTGSRLVVTLVHELLKQKKDLGMASLCLGGGGAMAVSIQRY